MCKERRRGRWGVRVDLSNARPRRVLAQLDVVVLTTASSTPLAELLFEFPSARYCMRYAVCGVRLRSEERTLLLLTLVCVDG